MTFDTTIDFHLKYNGAFMFIHEIDFCQRLSKILGQIISNVEQDYVDPVDEGGRRH